MSEDATGPGVLGNRSFVYYLGMYFSSRAAFQVAEVGLVWAVYAITGSALDVAIVGVASTAATLAITLPAGVWIDRHDRTKLLFASSAASTACLLLLTYFGDGPTFSLEGVVVVVVAWAVASEFYRSIGYAVVPDIVKPDELPVANGIAQSGFQLVGSVSTVMAGGLIVAAGVLSTYLFGALGYGLASALSLALIFRTRKSPKAKKPRGNMIKEVKEGFSWLIGQKGLFWLSVVALVDNFLFGIPMYFFVVYVSKTLGAGAFYFGAILALIAGGSAAGAFMSSRVSGALAKAGRVNLLSWGLVGGSMLLVLGAFPVIPVAMVATLVLGIGIGFGGNFWLTTAQNIVPSEMRGRYFAIDGLLSFVGGPPSVAVGGILIATEGAATIFVVTGVLMLLSTVAFAFVKSLWDLDGRPRAPQPAPVL